MARQGSLCQRILHSRCSLTALGLLCAMLLGRLTVFPSAFGAGEAFDMVDLRLRCEWRSEDARFWQVRLRVVDSHAPSTAISEILNHSESDLTSGAFDLSTDAQTLTFQPRHTTLGGAVQLRVRAIREAKLTIEVLASDRPDAEGVISTAKEIPLNDIITGTRIESDDDVARTESGIPSWTLQRVAKDELRLQTSRTSQLYAPGEEIRLSVHANALVHHASQALDLKYSLYRVGDGETVSTHRQLMTVNSLGDSEPITIKENAPVEPGVYEVRCQLAKDDENIWTRFRKSEPPIVQISHAVLVLSEDPQRQDATEWSTVGEIRPSESSWSVGHWLPKQTTQLLPDMTQIPGVSQIPSVSQIPGVNQIPRVSQFPGVSQPSLQNLDSDKYAGEPVSLIQPNETFQATLPVMTPGLPHKVAVRYPGSRASQLQIHIADANDPTHPVVTFRLDNDANIDAPDSWKTYSFVHYPTGDDQIWLTNLSDSDPVAFESVSVQAGPNLLSSLTAPQAKLRSTVLRLPNIDWVDSLSADIVNRNTLNECDPATIGLYRLWVASHRLQDFALASGMNGVLVPVNSGARTWFESDSLYHLQGSVREDQRLAVFMEIMKSSQLSIYLGLHPKMMLSEIERTIRNQVSLKSQLTRFHGGHGKQYNLLHPMVQRNLSELIGDVTRDFADHPSMAGVVLNCEADSHLQPIANAIVDPGTLIQFAEFSEMQVSFPELRAWAQQQGKAEVAAWIRDETRRTYQRLGKVLPNKSLYTVMQPVVDSDIPSEIAELEIRPYSQQWRSDRANLIPVEPFRYEPVGVLSRQTQREQQISSMAAPAPRTATAAIMGAEPDQHMLVRERVVADSSRIIDRLDPSMLIVEWPIAVTSFQSGLSELLQSYSATPHGNSGNSLVRIPPIDPAMQTIRIRAGTIGGSQCVSITSLASWTIDVELNMTADAEWTLTGGSSSEPVRLPELINNGNRVRVVMPPGQIAVLKSNSVASESPVSSWSAHVSGGSDALDDIKRKVTTIAERIGTLSDFEPSNTLTNGGFEQSGGIGLVGWLHAQHPPGCVRIDDNEFIEGKHSVRLTTDESTTTRTWLVSEMIEPPRSGRLAVSFYCRGEFRDDDSAHRLRVSIEATRRGEPIQYSRDFDVPRDGQWGARELVLEADGIEKESVDSLRLTIDSLSGGRVWIDDVQLHDRFPTSKERAVLQSQAFLAVQGLQRGNLTPSARLLNNYWARYLLTLGPSEKSKPVIEAVKLNEETPGVAERIRSWLPRHLRF